MLKTHRVTLESVKMNVIRVNSWRTVQPHTSLCWLPGLQTRAAAEPERQCLWQTLCVCLGAGLTVFACLSLVLRLVLLVNVNH